MTTRKSAVRAARRRAGWAAWTSRAARDAGFLDVTQAFRINKLGPGCLSRILRCTDLTGHQPACASAP